MHVCMHCMGCATLDGTLSVRDAKSTDGIEARAESTCTFTTGSTYGLFGKPTN
jgi:hypothetical protein